MQLDTSDFASFERVYGDDPNGRSLRTDQGEEGRFRCFTRDEITANGDNLNINWLRDISGDPEDALREPEDLIAAVQQHLQIAVSNLDTSSSGSCGTSSPRNAFDRMACSSRSQIELRVKTIPLWGL